MRHRKSFETDQRGSIAKVLILRFLTDRRGAAAFEFIIIAGFLFFLLLLPIGDVAVAALRYMQVHQAMRELGAIAQYKQPPNLTNPSTWPTLPTTVGNFSVTVGNSAFPTSENQINITVSCGTPVALDGAPICTAAQLSDTSTPKYVWMGAKVQLNPMVVKAITGGNVRYTERLQWPLL